MKTILSLTAIVCAAMILTGCPATSKPSGGATTGGSTSDTISVQRKTTDTIK